MDKSYRFVNPYNFVPLPSRADRTGNNHSETEDRLSGVIEYTLMTRTPLFIPNTSNQYALEQDGDRDQVHKSYDFFSYDDLSSYRGAEHKYALPAPARPVIPGSEMRGLLRSNYEIITDSCLSSLDTRAILSKRTMESFQAGLICKESAGKYSLYPATDCLWRTKGENSAVDERDWRPDYYTRKCYIQDKMPEGQRVSFLLEKREGHGEKPLARNVTALSNGDQPSRGLQTGYLIKGEAGPEVKPRNGISSQKHNAHVFRLKPGNALVNDLNVQLLDDTLKQYADHAGGKDQKGAYKNYREQWEKFRSKGKEGEYFPVYYSQINEEHVYLSPACKTREVYGVRLQDLAGEMAPCTKKDSLCPACRLFGTIAEDGGVASRIRVLDLEAEEKKDNKAYYLQPVTLKPLSSPKLSNVEFYLKRPQGADFWTYEYYIDANGRIHVQNGTLAGRKFYWHNLNAAKDSSIYEMMGGERTNQNETVRPLKPGVQFRGRIFFEALSDKELADVLYALTAGDTDPVDQKRHGLKLGAAKPLGFGSVAIEVNAVTLHQTIIDDVAGTVTTKHVPFSWKDACASDEVKKKEAFERITNFSTVATQTKEWGSDVRIDYPRSAPEEEGYQWFSNNHGGIIRRNGEVRSTNMPNSRSSMLLKEYMVPLNAELKDIGAHAHLDRGGNGYGQHGRRENRPRQWAGPERRNNVTPVEEQIYDATVTDNNGKVAFFVCKNGGLRGSIYFKDAKNRYEFQKDFAAGALVRVQYRGMHQGGDGKMHPWWVQPKEG